MSLAIAPYYLAFNAALLLLLSIKVTRERIRNKVSFGDGGVPALQRAIRVQANAVEYVPIMMLLLIVGELIGLDPPWLHGLGLVFSASRVLHAAGLTQTSSRSFGRYWGTVGTWSSLLAAILLVLVQAAGRM